MAELARLEAALIKADAAGDAVGAGILAKEIRRMRSAAAPTAEGADAKPAATPQAEAPKAPGFGKGYQIGFTDPLLALGQLARNIPAMPMVGGLGRAASPMVDALTQRAAEHEAARTAAGETGFDWGRLTGNVVNPVNLIPVGLMGRAATGAARIGHGALTGALAAPLTVPAGGEGGDFWAQKAIQSGAGAALGAAIPAGWDGAKTVGRGVRNVLEPLYGRGVERAAGRAANEVAGETRDAVIRALDEAGPIVPGSQPTAGQAAVSAGSPQFAGLQSEIKKYDPARYLAISEAQKAARLEHLGRVAQTPEKLNAATAARAAAGEINYEKAFRIAAQADPELSGLLTNPYIQKAMPVARDLMAAAGKNAPGKEGVDPGKMVSTQFLHNIKIGLDKQLLASGTDALTGAEKTAVLSAKKDLLSWMIKKNPKYDFARAEYAAASRPINQMEIGQQLSKTLETPLNAGERATAFANAVANAPQTIKKATGQRVASKLSDILSPSQIKTVDDVTRDLMRNAAFDRQAVAGGEAARKALGEIADPIMQINFLSRPMLFANAITRLLEGKANAATMRHLGKVMADPKKMAELMRAATPQERQLLGDVILRATSASASIGAARSQDQTGAGQ